MYVVQLLQLVPSFSTLDAFMFMSDESIFNLWRLRLFAQLYNRYETGVEERKCRCL